MDVRLEPGRSAADRRIPAPGDADGLWAAALRATDLPVAISDPRQPDNPLVFVNDAFCRLTGYARDDVLGRNCRFLQGPGTDPDTVGRIRRAIAAAETVSVDLLNYRQDGQPFWNRLLLAPVRRGGELAYFFSSQIDVTALREQLSGLERSNAVLSADLDSQVRAVAVSEARLLAAADAGELGFWELDLARRELFASQHCKSNFGRDPEQPFSYPQLQDAVHPDDRARMQAALAHTVATGDAYRIEYRIVRPDGRLAWVRILGRLERGPDGRPLCMAGISQEITDAVLARRRAALLAALDRDVYSAVEDPGEIAYRAVEALGRALDASRAGYGTIDAQAETITIVHDWNAPGVQGRTGTLHFRDYGSFIDDLKRGETVVVADARLDPRTCDAVDALAAVQALSIVNLPIRESGAVVALLYLNQATARAWTADELELVREVAHRTRQAVERRRAELDLRALADSLERQVQARTQELMAAEAALRQSQKMEAVGQLTGGLAHDLNNLLAAISGSLEMLQRHWPQDQAAMRYVGIGQAASNRAAALTHRLLAFSRQQALEPRSLDVNDLVRGFEDLIRRTIGPQVALELRMAEGLWPVHADPGQLENALLNLCINARDAMPGGGRLLVETDRFVIDADRARVHQMAPGAYVSIRVSDSGCGMPPEVCARAFDPFFTTKPIGMGTGLGLSMVYGFARQSGGHARIVSQVGVGTAVSLHLPRHDGPLEPDDAGHAAVAEVGSGRGQTILVVDDEAAVRTLIAEVLREQGYRVLEAEDGPGALQRLQDDRSVTLLLSDVGLPGGMNGRQVADAARALVADLQVLFVTGYAENALLSHGQLPPGMQILTKPFELNVLCQRVRAQIEAAGGAG